MSWFRKLWEEIPFPVSGKKSDMVAWVINVQEREKIRWQAIALSFVVTFITYVVTGKLVWGVP